MNYEFGYDIGVFCQKLEITLVNCAAYQYTYIYGEKIFAMYHGF